MTAAQIAGGLAALGLILDTLHVKNQSILANRFLDWWDKLHRIRLREATFASSRAISKFVDHWASPRIFSFRSLLVGLILNILVTYALFTYYRLGSIFELTSAASLRFRLVALVVAYSPGMIAYLLTRFFIRRLSRTSNVALVALVFAVNYLLARLVAAVTLGMYLAINTMPVIRVSYVLHGKYQHLPKPALNALVETFKFGAALANSIFIPSATAPLLLHLLVAGGFLMCYAVAQLLKVVDRLMEGIIHKLNDNIFTLVGASLAACYLLADLVISHVSATWLFQTANHQLVLAEHWLVTEVATKILYYTQRWLRSGPHI